MLSQRVACEQQDNLFAAIASVAGVVELQPGGLTGIAECNATYATGKKRINVLEIHGYLDPIVPWNGDADYPSIPVNMQNWAARSLCPSPPVVTFNSSNFYNQVCFVAIRHVRVCMHAYALPCMCCASRVLYLYTCACAYLRICIPAYTYINICIHARARAKNIAKTRTYSFPNASPPSRCGKTAELIETAPSSCSCRNSRGIRGPHGGRQSQRLMEPITCWISSIVCRRVRNHEYKYYN